MKVLLIGWNGADPAQLTTLLGRGLMPRLSELVSRGKSFTMAPVRPLNAASMWASLATGQPAWRHGVLTASEVDNARSAIQPASRRNLTSAPIWSILSAAGYRVHTYGWPATHPAEPLHGVAVSDQFADLGEASSVSPPEYFDALSELRLAPTEIDAASLVMLVPQAGELNPVGDQRLFLVAKFLASTASLHAAATWGLEHAAWDFAAVRYDGLARLRWARNRDADGIFDNVLTNAHRFFDMMLGRLLELAGMGTTVLLVAGSSSYEATRPPLGLLEPWQLIVGPSSLIADFGEPATICDLTPVILDLFGVAPSSSDEKRSSIIDEPRESSEDDDAEGDESIAHLIGLGYRERPDPFLQLAIEELQIEQRIRLAEALMESGEYERAGSVLAEALASEPRSVAIRSMLAEAYFLMGRYEDCRTRVLEMRAEGIETPLARIALAAIDLLRGAGEPLLHLRQAEALGSASATELVMIGQLYLGLRRRTDAARVLDTAITLAPRLAAAHADRALVFLYSGNANCAEKSARSAAECDKGSADAQYCLGLALARRGGLADAINAFKKGLALDRNNSGWVHGRLADLYERQRNDALAVHHRAIFDRLGRGDRRMNLNFQWLIEALL